MTSRERREGRALAWGGSDHPRARRATESYDEYRARLAVQDKQDRAYLKGRISFVSSFLGMEKGMGRTAVRSVTHPKKATIRERATRAVRSIFRRSA